MAKTSIKNWSPADKRYGWKFGGEGGDEVVGVREAAKMVGLSHKYLYEILKDADRSKPGSRAYPLRMGKRPHTGDICICVRSIEEYKRGRVPIEC